MVAAAYRTTISRIAISEGREIRVWMHPVVLLMDDGGDGESRRPSALKRLLLDKAACCSSWGMKSNGKFRVLVFFSFILTRVTIYRVVFSY